MTDRLQVSASSVNERLPRRLATSSVVDQVANEVLRLIEVRQLSAGDKLLAEPDLASQLGVGRSTVREAKQLLISKGFLESRGKVGTFVADPANRSLPIEMMQAMLTERRVEELHEARNILEVGAIQLACQSATDAELDGLHAHLDDLSVVASDRDFWAGTVAFHEEIVRCCHNATVSFMYKALSDSMRTEQLPLHVRENDRKVGVELHRRLISALRTRNPGAAAAAMTEHLALAHDHDLDVLRRG